MSETRALRRFLLDAVEAVIEQKRQEELLLALVLERFEPAPKGKTRRIDVYRHVAGRLRRAVNNTLCNEVRAALERVPGVYEVRSDGRRWFRGLQAKRP